MTENQAYSDRSWMNQSTLPTNRGYSDWANQPPIGPPPGPPPGFTATNPQTIPVQSNNTGNWRAPVVRTDNRTPKWYNCGNCTISNKKRLLYFLVIFLLTIAGWLIYNFAFK